jgi:excisionase family DNA binding protein
LTPPALLAGDAERTRLPQRRAARPELLKLRHSTVLDLSRRGVLPKFKIGKHWRYRRADLEEWIVRRRDAA